MSVPVFTPRSSTASSPMQSAFSPDIPSRDVPIPSIDHPTGGASGLDATVPRGLGSPEPYGGMSDAFEGMRLGTPNSGSRSYEFGQNLPYTFRGVYNTTPEPTSHARAHSTSKHVEFPDAAIPFVCRPAPKAPAKPKKYDPKDETPPDEPYFDRDFQKALANGKAVAAQIAKILGTCDLAKDEDSQIFSMIKTANELRKFDAPSTCVIGIVGDSGAGKSSLVNSLLHVNIAKTSGLGTACTRVVTEYRLRKPEHEAEFTFEIDRMVDSEIDDHVCELLSSYRRWHIPELEDKDMSEDERRRLKSQAELAWDTFTAAFGSRNEFTRAYLEDISNGADERIREQLAIWVRELPWPKESRENGWFGVSKTAEECKRKMQTFFGGQLWPFIKVIRIFLSSQVLKSGTVLADLPGFHDSNNARVKAAENYIYGCDEIFVVADISRVDSNKNVKMLFQKSLGCNLENGRPSQGLSLVCTRSEDVDPDDIEDEKFTDADKIAQLESTINEGLADSSAAGRQRVDDAKNKLTCMYITLRNDYVKRVFRQNHAEMFKNRRFSIFCVSNRMYKEQCKEASYDRLAIDVSGIPALRNHCHGIPAKAQFRIAHHFLTVNLKALIQRVQLWLTGGSRETMPNDAVVRKMLEALQTELQKSALSDVSKALASQKANSEAIMIQPITTNLSAWTAKACKRPTDWSAKYHHTQIAAFCRNEGTWGSEKAGRADWNLELIEPMVNAMASLWDSFADRSDGTLIELQSTVLKLLEGLISQVKDFQGAPLFAEALVTKIDSIKYIFNEATLVVNLRLDEIKRDTTQNHIGSYIYEIMHPAYLAGAKDDGSRQKPTERRLNRLIEAIGTPSDPILFKALRARLRTALSHLATETAETLKRDVRRALQEIAGDIEMLRGSEAKILAQNGDFLERLERELIVVMGKMENIREVADRAKSEADQRELS